MAARCYIHKFDTPLSGVTLRPLQLAMGEVTGMRI